MTGAKVWPVAVLGIMLLAGGALSAAQSSAAREQSSDLPVSVVLSVNEHASINGHHLAYDKRSNFIVHIGQHLSYNAGAFDNATRKPLPVQAMAFTLLASGQNFEMPSKPYTRAFWTGRFSIPKGLSGSARVRVAVTLLDGTTVGVASNYFRIRAPVVAWSKDAKASGYKASAHVVGTVTRPADGYVFATAMSSPSQPIDMQWRISCKRGAREFRSNGLVTDGGPGTNSGADVLKVLRLYPPNADSCSIDLTAQLHGTGSIDVGLVGDRWK
jgi:hypothetical protein